jgi:hypothetical protein
MQEVDVVLTIPFFNTLYRDQVAGYAVLRQLSILGHAGTEDAELDRVEHAPAVRESLEAVPRLAGIQHQTGGIGRQELRRSFLERHAFAGMPDRHGGSIPGREEPFILGRELALQPPQGQAAGVLTLIGAPVCAIRY